MIRIPTTSLRTSAESIKKATSLFLLILAVAITSNSIVPVDAKLVCSSTKECEDQLRIGSECVDGFCSNPFVEGCFKTMLGSLSEEELAERNLASEVLGALDGRVCNSDDEEEDGSSPVCLPNEFDYFEIRVHNANWESSIFLAWIMQIMLMEVLQVPVTVGRNSGVTEISSFYSPENTMAYSSGPYAWDALRVEDDCENTDEDCVDVLPEVWNGQVSKWTQMMFEGAIEPVDGCGQVGKLGWFVPGATARKDDSLVSYYGLQGEDRRAKLAKCFKRPTTWYEYCEEVSINNCTTPDEFAVHYPEKEAQAGKYFEEGQFTGYFRMLPENDCTLYPETCTGYIVGPICTWSTNVEAQLYWNNIFGLKPDGPSEPNKGYEYSSQIEIWRAANATKSDVIMWWWQPEALVEEFSASDWSFQQIILPTVTDICSEARIGVDDRCQEDIALRRGDPLGSCDYEAHALQKVLSSNLQKKTMAEPESSRSPGYPFIRSMKTTDLEIQSMLKKWMAINKDPYGNDAREMVCSWVVDHVDKLINFIPPGHPKVLDPSGSFNQGYLHFAMALAIFSFLGLLATSGFVHKYRRTKVFVYAQEIFIQMILLGFILVIVGGLLYAYEPTNFSCVARNWLTTLGFSTVLGVVLVKMSTINRIMQNTKKSRRIKVSMRDMFISLGLIVMIDLIFLIAWTVQSPPKAVEKLDLPEEFSTTVKVSLICRSEQIIWSLIPKIWHTLLLLVASVLAFQSRGIVPEFNESRTIGIMVYSHFLFMVFRLIVFFLGIRGDVAPNVFQASISYLYTFDTLFATAIYVIPKCIEAKKDSADYFPRASTSKSFKGNQTPNINPKLNINHGRQPFGLKGFRDESMVVNFESEASVSNLRGRQPRRRTSRSSIEPPLSLKEDSLHEEEWNMMRDANRDSIREEIESDENDAEATKELTHPASNETPIRTNLSSHDATTESDIEGVIDG